VAVLNHQPGRVLWGAWFKPLQVFQAFPGFPTLALSYIACSR